MSEGIEVSGIRFEEAKISNVQDNRVFASINRSDITSLDFRWGILSQRPLLQTIFGALISLFGLSVVRFVYTWLKQGGTAFDYQIMLTLLLPIGVGDHRRIENGLFSINTTSFRQRQDDLSKAAGSKLTGAIVKATQK